MIFDYLFFLVTIDSIKEIRLGKTTERLRECTHQFQNESLFSIIYTNGNNQYASLDLVASSADEANIWVTGLSCLIAGQGSAPSTAGKNEPIECDYSLIYSLGKDQNILRCTVESSH